MTVFQIAEYNFIEVFIDGNTTTTTLVRSTQRGDVVFGFDIIEWICKKIVALFVC